MITISSTCTECGRQVTFDVDEQELARWESGELIQRAMPNLSADNREMLVSGICGQCFDRMFADEN